MDAMLDTPAALDTVTINGFPADRLDLARELLAKAHAKLARAAAKAGATIPSEPQLTVVGERVQLYCPKCKCREAAEVSTTSRACSNHCNDDAPMQTHLVLDLALTSERPRLAGWEFLFVVEPLVGGNLIRQVPGAQDVPDTTPWRTKSIACDHCKTTRRRAETFVLRATGEDPTIPVGTIREVGRNCLEAFLGGMSPAALVARLTWARLVREAGDYDEESGGFSQHGPQVMQPEQFMQYVVASVRVDGWTSRAAARDSDGERRASADRAIYLMFPPWGASEQGRRLWREERERIAPSDADKARGLEVLAWAKALPEDSDEYTRNLRLMALQPHVQINPKHYGILASAVNAWERAIGRQLREAREKAALASQSNVHVGAEGERQEWNVTVERVADVDTDYGSLHIHTLRVQNTGEALVWKTTSKRMDIGWSGRVRGTVKRHSEYRGQKQTELSRCTVVEPKAPKAPKKFIKETTQP